MRYDLAEAVCVWRITEAARTCPVVRVRVGRATRANAESRLPVVTEFVEENFLFDTGADVSMIGRPLARELGMELAGKKMDVRLADGQKRLGFSSAITVQLRCVWLPLDCFVQTSDEMPIIGMNGLRTRFDFVVNDHAVYLFKKHEVARRS